MDPRTLKVCAVCFGAGAIGLLVLLIATPSLGFWGSVLGTFASAAIGYFGYEFRVTLRALALASREALPTIFRVTPLVLRAIGRFLARPRPVIFVQTFFSAALGVYLGLLMVEGEPMWLILKIVSIFALVALMALFGTSCGSYAQRQLMRVRQVTEDRWVHLYDPIEQNEDLSYVMAVSWPEFLRFEFDTIVNVVLIPFLVLHQIFIVFPATVIGIVWTTIKLIHSNERMVCAVDGPLGMLAAYAALRVYVGAPIMYTPLTTFGAVLFAGAFSTLIGLVNYELLSKRVLKTVPVRVR